MPCVPCARTADHASRAPTLRAPSAPPVRAKTFSLDLSFAVTQPPLLEGEQGFARKGPDAKQASYYYSEPHLAVTGAVVIDARRFAARGVAWCDHEWSSEYLAADAAGWD